MKHNFFKRIVVLALMFCMMLTMIPLQLSHSDVEAVSGINNLTCSGFISNSTARSYIDTMMRYYINNNSSIRNSLDNGQSAVFMFEGGSDNYWGGSTYANNAYNVRNQAVIIVVKKNSSGNAYIDYYCENSSSIPGQPTWCTGAAYSGSTTLMDGIYSFYTWNHTGPYAAFQVNLSASNGNGYYTPPGNLNGLKNGASGINIHTRSSNIAGGSSLGWVWSAGCQCIGTGNGTSNEFNGLMKSVCNITWNSWINYSSKIFNTFATVGTYKGYYIVDRQLALKNPSGTKYGSGSLINLYNTTALTNITAKSTSAMKAAGADKVDYVSQCTYYASHAKIKVKQDATWSRLLPCSSSVDSTSTTVSSYNAGETLTATGLYKNTKGEYWYRTVSKSGSTAYILSTGVTYVDDIYTDVKISGHTAPNGHVKGSSYIVSGTVSTQYNELTNIAANVYKGLGTSGTKVTGASATPSGTSYNIANSTVDANVLMGILETGPHTLVITAAYKNYYMSGSTLKNNTGARTLVTDYFMVVPSSVSQSSCSHSYQNYVIKSPTCTTNGESLQACPTCGHVKGTVVTTGSHAYGNWVVTDATCTKEGVKVRTCSKCGDKESQIIPFGGHKYNEEKIDATCSDLEKVKYTCSVCSHTYVDYADKRANWSESKPDVDNESLIETKVEYRYSDYSQMTSYSSAAEGYTVEKTEWEKNVNGVVQYVKSWPAGFNTSNSLYTTYNKTPKTAVTNTNDKTVIDSDKVVGYLYYHWCYTDSYYSTDSKKENYTTFHAYYSTTAPSTYQCDTSDMSYCTAHSSCSNSDWFFVCEVREQKYTTYKKLYTLSKWSDWSQWSETHAAPSDTRKVESRTLYRFIDESAFGAHNYVDGVCTLCGRGAPDYYLFGFINGADYACEADSENIGIYKFENDTLTAQFTENSYVAVKTGDNIDWFMTDGYPGDTAMSATLYNVNKGINAEKLFVPKGVEIIFTLKHNSDGSLELSYVFGNCEHKNHNTSGVCTACRQKVEHTYENGVCTVCSKAAPVYYLFGFVNGADYEGLDYRFVNGSLITEFTSDSYVAVKTGDNSVWYMTDGYQGDDAKSVVLYDAAALDGRGDKLFVPKGVSVEFTLKDNEDGTFTLSYSTSICKHLRHSKEGVCLSCGETVEHYFLNGGCVSCGLSCEHNWGEDRICTICGKEKPGYYLYGFINGADYDGMDYKFTDGELKVKFTDTTYIAVKDGDNAVRYMTDGYHDGATEVQLFDSSILSGTGDKLFIPKGREITFKLVENEDGSLTLSYDAAQCPHKYHNSNAVCLSCGEDVEHTIVDGICTGCGLNCKHNWYNSFCTKCGCPEPLFYLFGFINGEDYEGTDYKFDNGKLVAVFEGDTYVGVKTNDEVYYMAESFPGKDVTEETLHNDVLLPDLGEKMFVPGGYKIIFTISEMNDRSLILSYTVGECTHSEHNTDGICKNCGEPVEHSFKDGYCTHCNCKCIHNFERGKCTICSSIEPDYYLFGFINGAEYGCDSDADRIGIYKFTEGKLVTIFTHDSYVAVKTGDNMQWYMTDGYLDADVREATLYNTDLGIDAEKLFIPKGRLVEFTLVNNGDETLTITYTIADCEHTSHNAQGECTTCGEFTGHNFVNSVCTVCFAQCEHNWKDSECTICFAKCEHIWINGKCTRCDLVCEHGFEEGYCNKCGFVCSHSFEHGECTVCDVVCVHNFISGTCYICKEVCEHTYLNGNCTVCEYKCKHNYEDGDCTICDVVCGHKWNGGECIVCDVVCSHTWEDGVCKVCSLSCTHSFIDGVCSNCNLKCEHSFVSGKCNICGTKCEHIYKDGICSVCGISCAHDYQDGVCTNCRKENDFYLIGNINGRDVGFESDYNSKGTYLFVNGTLSVTFTGDSYVAVKTGDNRDWYMASEQNSGKVSYLYNTLTGKVSDLMFVPGGVEATFTLESMGNDSFKLSYTVQNCKHQSHNIKGKCLGCNIDVKHTYEDGFCTQCYAIDPGKEMYLFGTINGVDYGYNSDAARIGDYKFVDRQLTVTFKEDSYVAVKSFDNKDWYMSDGSDTYTGNAILYNTRLGKGADLLFVPGGVEVLFTLTRQADGNYRLSYTYTNSDEKRINLKYTSMDIASEMRYELYFTTEGVENVPLSDMGMIVYDPAESGAISVISGAVSDGSYYLVQSDPVHAKHFGNEIVMKAYVKLPDGTYLYSDPVEYSALHYANSVLENKNSSKEHKAMVVAMLNYGAAAQQYFDYKADALVNSALTKAQQSLVEEYSVDMAENVSTISQSKAGEFGKQGTGFVMYPGANFSNTLFTVTCNLKTNKQVDGDVTLYYWDAETYASVQKLTKANATGTLKMEMSVDGAYSAEIASIAAKDLDDTIYIAAVFNSEGSTCSSGVIAYSMAEYCKLNAQNDSSLMQELAQAAIVYGYYAEKHFGER